MTSYRKHGTAFFVNTNPFSVGFGALQSLLLWRRISLPSSALWLSHRPVSVYREVIEVRLSFLSRDYLCL